VSEPEGPRPSVGPWRAIGRKLRKNRVATTGLAILVVLYVCACFAGFLAPYHYADQDSDSARVGPMLLGSYAFTPVEVPSEVEEGATAQTWTAAWRWFEGGVHFHDSKGEFTLRPHVHPIVEKEYTDEYGDTSYVRGGVDTSVSLPVEFFVEGEEHEVASLLGFLPITGKTHLFGVKKPPGVKGSVRIYLLGSDKTGRDIFSRLLYGAQVSLSVGLVGIAISMTLGMLLGGISGYFHGKVDFVVMRVVEVILAVPGLYLVIVLGGFLRQVRIGDKPLTSRQTYLMIVFVLAFIAWASISRVIRGMVLSIREADYVMAARACGVPAWRIVTRHILPNTLSYAIVTATLYVPYYILGEVSLSFLALGIQEPEASWGNMLREAQDASQLVATPWVIVPGVFIFVTVLAFNFLGDGLRDAADPKAVIVRSAKNFATSFDTQRDASPPAPTTSLMSVEERYANSSAGIMNTASTCGASARFVSAIWYSNSKSLAVRTPRRSTESPLAFAYSTASPRNDATSTLRWRRVWRRSIAMRSSTVKTGFLRELSATATTRRSKTRAPRAMRSRCPSVTGSKLPG
jgi:peptide/nickel transport system permease protein